MSRPAAPHLPASLALVVPLLALATPAAAAPPTRIVSLNLCADDYLVRLADRRQIAALTRLSRDPVMSPVARAARTYPVARGSAEEVLALRPDLIVTALGGPPATMALVAGRGAALLDLPLAQDHAAIVAQVRRIADAVGHPRRGEALVRRMAAALARVPAAAGGGRTAAFYQRRGYLDGGGTLVDALVRRVGLRNLAARLGRPPLSRLSLEELVAARPDYLIVERGAIEDRGTELLHHPALAAIPRLTLDPAWISCGGPSYVLAAASLARQLARPPAVRPGPPRP